MAFPIDNPIPDAELVFRHVPKAKKKPEDFWVTAQNRPTSAVFRDKSGEVSVDREKYGGSARSVQRTNSLAVVSLSAMNCRDNGKDVVHQPVQEWEEYGPNPAHSVIRDPEGTTLTDLQEIAARDALARAAVLVWMAPGEPDFI